MKKQSSKKKELHQVYAALDNWELAKRESAVTFCVRKGKKKLGELSIGRGSVAWTPAKKQTQLTVSWPYFASMFEAAFE